MQIETSQAVAAELRAIMARRNLKQIELAAYLGISQPAVSTRLNGQQALTIDELIRIGDFLREDVAAILGTVVRGQLEPAS